MKAIHATVTAANIGLAVGCASAPEMDCTDMANELA